MWIYHIVDIIVLSYWDALLKDSVSFFLNKKIKKNRLHVITNIEHQECSICDQLMKEAQVGNKWSVRFFFNIHVNTMIAISVFQFTT